MGFTAPSVQGQAEAIQQALKAGVLPDSVSYVETHGTGTRLGDPIEIAALTKVVSSEDAEERVLRDRFTVKTNVGTWIQRPVLRA